MAYRNLNKEDMDPGGNDRSSARKGTPVLKESYRKCSGVLCKWILNTWLVGDEEKVKVTLSLCSIKPNAMKAYGGAEV